MIIELIISFLLQMVFTIGIIFLFGFLIAVCNRKFYSNFGSKSMLVCYITGCIGTPVHELSHALFCVIFGHKITEIKLFQINAADGTLGYVNHSYNPKNIYHRIGNFFIGIAPIIVISGILFLIAWLLMPAMISELYINVSSIKLSNGIASVLSEFFDIIKVFFSYANCWQWWAFLIVGSILALHMTLSGADIKGALSGLIFVVVIFLIIDIVLALIGGLLLNDFTQIILGAGGYLLCILMLSLGVSLIAVAISFVVGIFCR